MNLGSDVVITITGIVLVFAILVLLMLIKMCIRDRSWAALWAWKRWRQSAVWAV